MNNRTGYLLNWKDNVKKLTALLYYPVDKGFDYCAKRSR
jgi:hypothetical protein